MAVSLLVQQLSESDKDSWRTLFDAYNAFYGRIGETALDPAITETTWQRIFDSQEPVFGLVARQDGALVGFTHYLFHRSTTSIEPSCYLQDLFTVPEVRGQGVGRALIESVYEKAREAGAARVYWQTHENNAVARKLYDGIAENSGFIVYRKLMKD